MPNLLDDDDDDDDDAPDLPAVDASNTGVITPGRALIAAALRTIDTEAARRALAGPIPAIVIITAPSSAWARALSRYSVLVRRAKNDPEGAGRTAHLSTRTSQFVDEWFLAIGTDTGPLLRPVYRTKAMALYLEPLTVSRVLKKLAKVAETPAQTGCNVSGHSPRVGAAQQLVLDGHGILKIMRAGGWR